MSEVQEIVGKLTEAQREGLHGEVLGGVIRTTRCNRVLVEKGLAFPQTRALTRLGLQVRAHLQATRGEGR